MEKPGRTQPSKGKPKPQSGKRIVGTSRIQINEDNASTLIGSIVEKGVLDDPKTKPSKLTPAPKPSVLPFPVARHRSHGPHWSPIGIRRVAGHDHGGDIDGGDEDDEDKELANSGQIASFALPVQKKEKKVVDLSRWREFMQSENQPESNKTRVRHVEAAVFSEDIEQVELAHGTNISGNNPFGEVVSRERNVEPYSSSFSVINVSNKSLDKSVATGSSDNWEQDYNLKTNASYVSSIRDSEPMCFDKHIGEVKGEVDSRMKTQNTMELYPSYFNLPDRQAEFPELLEKAIYNPNNSGNGHSNLSLESQIDAENQARLAGMSPDEIAHAQAEIMEKMNPALLDMLKRRGVEKLKKQNHSDAAVSSNCKLDTTAIEGRPVQNLEVSHLAPVTSRKDSFSALETGVIQKTEPGSSNLWSAWSDRVEAVRKLRFSLDGNVVESGSDSVSADTSGQNWQSIDNVAERDFLRTDGDPGGVGYTIKEAVALSRSVVPGQRSFALHLLASVLDKAICTITHYQVDFITKDTGVDHSVDWEAVWAFALGPEPELILSLRICLDDNHSSVVLACARVIQCILSFNLNEHFFDNLENMDTFGRDVCTAPIFRSKPEINGGFLHGGFWKYSAKSSNVLPFGENNDEESDEKHTIQDDIIVAGQDFIAGLVRMGILPRIRYLLETDPVPVLEEYLISVLVAIARHSPTGANSIVECRRLVQTVVNRFTMSWSVDIHPSKVMSVRLLKVLARADRRSCKEFVNNGTFQTMTWHLYQSPRSLEKWIMLGKEKLKLSAALMVEQLQLWKVCIRYGYCTSYFSGIFPAMCLWLNPPTVQNLLERNALKEFSMISKEAYLVLSALTSRLPEFHLHMHRDHQISEFIADDSETWLWSYASPMIDLGMKWIALRGDTFVSELFERGSRARNESTCHHESVTSLLWIYSAILQMLFTILDKIDPKNSRVTSDEDGLLPWLPEFVPKIGLEIIRNKFLGFSDAKSANNGTCIGRCGSFMEQLCQLRLRSDSDNGLASVCCLYGLVQVIVTIDRLIQLAKASMPNPPPNGCDLSREGRILEKGILQGSLAEIRNMLHIFVNLVASDWHTIQGIETFGRGGPAPGAGIGWGASSGGFWSTNALLAQKDAGLLVFLLQIFPIESITGVTSAENQTIVAERINAALGACLTVGPRDNVIMEKALDFLLRGSTLRYWDICVRQYLAFIRKNKPVAWEYKEEDFLLVSQLLSSHFRKRWLCQKKKVSSGNNKSSVQKPKPKGTTLETIHEDATSHEEAEVYCNSLVVEWAHQRLPLPTHWFLSPISTATVDKSAGKHENFTTHNLFPEPEDTCEIAKAGLFFVLGLEAMSYTGSNATLPLVKCVPLVWKLHSLSMILLVGMDILEDEKSRVFYEALQELFGEFLNQECCSRSAAKIQMNAETEKEQDFGLLRFKSEIHESYPTFIETLVEHFGAESYGDVLYSRQVAVYLHRYVEPSVRLAAWNALSNARVLELLPPLEKSLAASEGYLQPVEDNEGILEAYVKSWVSGALDRAAARGSLAFTLVLHHISSFLFLELSEDRTLLRNKLAKALLRDYSRKRQHEEFMLDLIRYGKSSPTQIPEQEESAMSMSSVEKRFAVLTETCEGNVTLHAEVEKLKSAFAKQLVKS